MDFPKRLISLGIGTAIGTTVTGTASADQVATWNLADVLNGAAAGTDGAISGFAFAPAPAPDGITGNIFGFTNETGCKNASTSPICEPIAFDAGEIGTRVFATGFNFGGTGIFRPNVVNSTGSGSISATIDIDASGTRTLNFSALDFGGIFNAQQFYLAPDDLTNCTGTAGCGSVPGTGGPNTGYNIEQLVPLGGPDFGVVLRYVGTIQQAGPFLGFEANWRIEGNMTVTDEPPVIFKSGADPASVVSGSAYTDAGFVCQDVVDGAITPSYAISGAPAPDCDLTAGEVTALAPQFTCDVTCADSSTGSSTDSRTVNVTGGGASPLVASILPGSRSVQVNNAASVFATMINSGATDATGCDITPITPVTGGFLYQTTDPVTNALTGTPNTPADIPAGGNQTFTFAFTPTAALVPTDVEMSYDCANTSPAPVTVGLNTLLLSASITPVPDIVALAATPTGDGIVDLPGSLGTNAFALATVNVGSGDTITVRVDTGGISLPVTLSVCETNPATGACLSPPAASVTTTINAGTTPTFAIFVNGNGVVPFDPGNNRIFVRFEDAGGVVRGSTSVAVRTL